MSNNSKTPINTPPKIPKISPKQIAHAYIYGSYSEFTDEFICGGFIIFNNKKHILQYRIRDCDFKEIKSEAGELLAAMKVIEKAVELKIRKLNLFYECLGVEMWANGEGKRDNNCIEKYYNFMQSVRDIILINFIRIEHSSDEMRVEI